eukprot:3155893-Pyramimonas_sp.AAC.1
MQRKARRTSAGEERHASLASHGLGNEGLAGTGRTHEQAAAGDLGAELGVLVGVLQEVNNLLELELGTVHALKDINDTSDQPRVGAEQSLRRPRKER